MGNITTKLFDFAGDVADLIGSAAEKLGKLLGKVVILLKAMKSIFGKKANLPKVIDEKVTSFETAFEGMTLEDMGYALKDLGDMCIQHSNNS
uniref:Uncharacterized protein n=1 Tax=Panagrolaimus sp. JU765 TaxID=591449 RepID=A0AC34QEP7_9BILA